MPAELAYSPLLPWLGWHLRIYAVMAGIFAIGPVALFLMAWQLSGKPGWAFVAGLVYSLGSPEPRRLDVTLIWGEAPHQLALATVCLAVLAWAPGWRRLAALAPESVWTWGSWVGLLALGVGFVGLWFLTLSWVAVRRFAVLLAWVTVAIPVIYYRWDVCCYNSRDGTGRRRSWRWFCWWFSGRSVYWRGGRGGCWRGWLCWELREFGN